jgi:hypothetical protein
VLVIVRVDVVDVVVLTTEVLVVVVLTVTVVAKDEVVETSCCGDGQSTIVG